MIYWFEKVNEWAGKISAFLFIPLFVLIFYEVVARYVFNSPTIFAWDISIQIFSAVLMLTGGYTLLKGGHVSVDLIFRFLSPKQAGILNLFHLIFCFITAFVLIWYGSILGWESFVINERMSTMWEPVFWPIKMMVPLGGILILMQGIVNLIREIKALVLHKENS